MPQNVFQIYGPNIKGENDYFCVCAVKIRTLKIKYKTLILGFKIQLHLCRLLQFENPNELREDQVNVIERYVILMYARGSGLGSVNVCQRYLFTYKNLLSESLPPTYDAHIQHLKRAFCQGR